MPEITIQQSSLDLAANVTAAILVCKNKSISLHFLNHSFTQILRRERTDGRICHCSANQHDHFHVVANQGYWITDVVKKI